MPERDIVAYCNGLSKAEFWSLGMGDVQNLLEEAIEEIEQERANRECHQTVFHTCPRCGYSDSPAGTSLQLNDG